MKDRKTSKVKNTNGLNESLVIRRTKERKGRDGDTLIIIRSG